MAAAQQVPEAKRGSLGVSAPGYEHKVINDEGAEVPHGVTGEICVRGTAMMRGMIGKHWYELVDRDGWLRHQGRRLPRRRRAPVLFRRTH